MLKRSRRSSGLWVAIAVLLASACRPSGCASGGSQRGKPAARSSSAPSAAPEPEALALCSALHEAPAKRHALCCGGAPATLLNDECVRHVSTALRAGTIAIDHARVERCRARIATELSGCDWVAPTLPRLPEACADLVIGRVSSGGACHSSLECEANLHCAGQSTGKAGVCRSPEPLGAGCGVGVDPLATYTGERALEQKKPACLDHCSLVTHRCEARPAIGAACRASAQCAAGQRCREGQCEATPPLGEGQRCDEGRCVGGLRCVRGLCTARSVAGDACQTDLDCAEGGCATGPDGARRCGMKCAASLEALGPTATSRPALNLSARQNAAGLPLPSASPAKGVPR